VAAQGVGGARPRLVTGRGLGCMGAHNLPCHVASSPPKITQTPSSTAPIHRIRVADAHPLVWLLHPLNFPLGVGAGNVATVPRSTRGGRNSNGKKTTRQFEKTEKRQAAAESVKPAGRTTSFFAKVGLPIDDDISPLCNTAYDALKTCVYHVTLLACVV
jgi:hypothetical protein